MHSYLKRGGFILASVAFGCGGAAKSDGEGGGTCGGWTAHACNAAEYCAYEPGQSCGAADAESVCKPRPSECPAVLAPVCGCDGKTYGNVCEAAGGGVGILKNGPCDA
jgi:hypothetical protein